MTDKFLKSLGLTDEVIKTVLEQSNKELEAEKKKTEATNASLSELQSKLDTALKTAKDASKTQEAYKALQEASSKTTAELNSKIALLERTGQVKDYLSSKKFINNITRDAISDKLVSLLGSEEAKGHNLDTLFNQVVKGQENIFAQEAVAPPAITSMTGGVIGSNNTSGASSVLDDVATMRSICGLPPIQERG